MREVLEGRMAPTVNPAREAATRAAVRSTIGFTVLAACGHPCFLLGAYLGPLLLKGSS